VVHTRPASPHATREPLQFGAEIYGHAGPEADLEALQLALDCLKAARLPSFTVDLADVRIVSALLADVALNAETRAQVHAALAAKDVSELDALTRDFPPASRSGLLALLQLYGDASVLDKAEKVLPPLPAVREALSSLKALASHLTGTQLSFDLADLRGYAYYSGVRFAIYAQGASDALVRGGRYDEVGAVFGRKRPAVGFSLDLKTLVNVVEARPLRAAIRAPWGESPALLQAIASLRARGETVVCVLPGHESEIDEFQCDRELKEVAGQWVVSAKQL
jgi:ATP phosphoribosyltransferase regulatory subunit